MIEEEKTYFIVNKAGAVHEVTESHAKNRLANSIGFRLAKKAEIQKYYDADIQRHDRPIAKPFTPSKLEAQELPAQSKPKKKTAKATAKD